jgi:hypothetical protein
MMQNEPLLDRYEGVLQNIEAMVVDVFREHTELTDYSVQRVYEYLIGLYEAELRGRNPRNPRLNALEEELLVRVQAICSWQLGRGAPIADLPDLQGEPVDVDTMIQIIRRLLKSVKFWTKQGGRQGYLNYIAQFV